MAIKRLGKPDSLVRNANDWKNTLLNEIKVKGNYKDVAEKFKNKYRQTDVQERLKEMYFGKCCYCGKGIGACSYEHIEHLKPKSIFPELCYEWNNLHWICMKCNMIKKAKWDYNNPILDPTVDEFTDYLEVDRFTGYMKEINANLRAVTTIRDPQLNRPELIKARKLILRKLDHLANLVKSTPTHKDDQLFIQFLNDFIADEEDFSDIFKQYINDILT